MSRSSKDAVRRRMRVTGECYQRAYCEIAQLRDGHPLIPDAWLAAQRRVESAVLQRLLHGARYHWPSGTRSVSPLVVETVYPSPAGLHLVVPLGAFVSGGNQSRRKRNRPRAPSTRGATRRITTEGY